MRDRSPRVASEIAIRAHAYVTDFHVFGLHALAHVLVRFANKELGLDRSWRVPFDRATRARVRK